MPRHEHPRSFALPLLLFACACGEKVEADFTAVNLSTTFPTRYGIDRLIVSAKAEDGKVALEPATFMVMPPMEVETQTETANLILEEAFDGQLVTFTVDGAKPEGVVATGETTLRLAAGFILTATVGLEVADTCGDGIVDPAEDCDDANQREGDGCRSCTLEDGFTCIGAPSECFVEARTAVVDDDADCPGTGTHTAPFCALSSGVAAPWASTVAVRPGTYGERLVLDRPLELVGAEGAVLEVGAAPAIRIEGAVATVRGLTIRGDRGIGGGITVTGPDAMVKIRDNVIGPGSTVALDVGEGVFIEIEKNRMESHAGGALRLATDVGFIATNNVLLDNGGPSAPFGGVWFERAPANSVFANNTIAGNQAATSSTAGMVCAAAAEVVSSIVWDQPSLPACTFSYSDVGPITSSTVTVGEASFSEDPRLTADGHLEAGSPCIDAGDPQSIAEGVAPTDDIDGDGRPMGGGIDIGADEV